MKRLLFSLALLSPLCAEPCNTSHVGHVTLTVCISAEGDRHFFISTTDPDTYAFRLGIRTDASGMYIVAENYGNGAVHVAPKIKGKLQHVTVTELHEFNNSAFSVDTGTLQ